MNTDSDKLKRFRKKENISQAALAQILGVTQASIAMIENKTRPASATFKLAFTKAYGIDWDTQLASGETYTYEHLNKCYENIVSVPFYSAKAAAGVGAELPEYPEKDSFYFDKRWIQNILGADYRHCTIITAEGDSMEPTIDNGDLLLVDTSVQEVINNKIFIIQDEHNLRVKRLKQDWNGDIYLLSDNKDYLPEKVMHSISIIGKVVWNGSKESV